MPLNYHETYGLNTVTAATVEITDEGFLGRPIILNRAAGITATLPFATGSGNRYDFYVQTAVTSNAHLIRVGRGADTMVGNAVLFADGGDTVVGFAAVAGTSDTVDMNGSARGGLAGARVTVIDIAPNLWTVEVISDASGTEATPFTATVA